MNVLLLLWLCGHLFVRYSQGYVGQTCYNIWGYCQKNEVCDFDRWGYGRCKCDRYHYWEVGRGRRKHCAMNSWNKCVYDEDCYNDERLECVVNDNGYHECKCSKPYYHTPEDKCELDKRVYLGAGVGAAVLVVVVLIVVKFKRYKRRQRQSISPQQQQPQQQQQQQQPQQPQPQPPHDDGQTPNDGGETYHVYKNSGFSGLSEAPPAYKTLFPDTK